MSTPNVYQVKPEMVAGKELNAFLRDCIAKEFEGQNCVIISESTRDQLVNYSATPRKIASFSVNTATGNHSIFFDVTECGTFKWA